MKKTKFLIFACLFLVSQAFAQQTQSFAQYWFGVNFEKKEQNNSIKKTPPKAKTPSLRSGETIKTRISTLDLSKPNNPTTFELNEKNVWEETYNDEDYSFIEFNNSTFMFAHLIGGEGSAWGGSSWDGFTYSKNNDNADHGQGTSSDWIQNQWGNMAGGGIKTDAKGNILKDENGVVLTDKEAPYLLAYWSSFMDGYYDYRILTVLFDTLCQAKDIYVNNSPWPYYGNLNGDGFARKLDKEGDFFKLIIHGLDENADDNGKTVEYYLAKFENGELIQSANWENVDLTALGEVGGIYFTMESSDSDPVFGINTAAYFCLDKLRIEKTVLAEHNYTITAPEGADVSVGAKNYTGYNYRPFTEEEALATSTLDGKVTYYYNLTGEHSYRVSQAGKLTQVGIFKPSSSDVSLEITEEQLSSHKPTDIDRDPSSNNGYNVADIFLNINAKGHLLLDKDNTHQLVHLRNWTMVKDVIANYFLEPDYHYSVINENGEPDNSVVTVNEQGLLTAVGNGIAIVLVTYDAVNANYALGGPFYSALWAENTGVFVVSVGETEANMNSGMEINASLNTDEAHKMATTAVDAELDVFYYLGENEGFDYTFTPSGATSVLLAQPVITENKLTYDEFSNKNVIANEDGSYTVRLVNGRNIVKLTSTEGESYQVLTAKAVNYTLENLTNPDEELSPGDEISITFNTLYHPCGKLAGIYNMSAAIQYNNIEVSMSPYGGIGQYKFASGAQTYKITIPDDFEGTEFTLTNGVIKTYGYGSPYGAHRSITLETGAVPNLNASLRTAYFGALPQITIPMKGSASQEPAIKKVEFTNENINAGIVKAEVENAEVAIGDKWIAVLAKSVKTLEAIDGNGPFHAMSFYQNMTLQAIEGGEGVTNIGKNSFNYCSNITSFSFPELENIGESAFLACGNLTEINFPKITTIDQTAFAYCNKLQTITLGSNLSESTDIIFGKEVFSSVKTENVDLVLGANVEVDGEDCDIANNIYKGYTFKSISGGKPAIIDIATAVAAPILDQIHTGSSIEPTLTLTIGDTELNEGEDYELIYSNNIAVGIATISIRGIGNYSGTQSVEFTIIAQSTTAIDTVDANSATIVGYCNLMGQSISKAPERGIYIILYSNGTSQKNVKQ